LNYCAKDPTERAQAERLGISVNAYVTIVVNERWERKKKDCCTSI
jgi:hypothetical protein